MAASTKDLRGVYHRLLSPRVATLIVTLRVDMLPNVMAAAWLTPVSVNPPILAVCIAPNCLTHKLLQNGGEFTINIPPSSLQDKVEIAGYNSGLNYDKSKLFHYVPATRVNVPIIEEALGTIECRVNRILEMGDHSVVFGNVIAANAKGFGEVWKSTSPLLHLGSNYFTELKKM